MWKMQGSLPWIISGTVSAFARLEHRLGTCGFLGGVVRLPHNAVLEGLAGIKRDKSK
jgi:hypothetical protein